MNAKKPESIDQYIASFPPETQKLLKQMRAAIQKAAPEATEAISYGMPAFNQNGYLVYFGGYKTHIGLYPAPRAIDAFKDELSAYKGAKGTVQFPLDQPLPVNLIARIVKFRVAENMEKKAKTAKTATPKKAASKYSAAMAKPTAQPAGFMAAVSEPARRALEGAGIKTLKQLAKYTEADVLALHGMGPASIPKLKEVLDAEGLSFRN
jgi:uncharacterized protein YdhG (YjbR/CyaY superfamily)